MYCTAPLSPRNKGRLRSFHDDDDDDLKSRRLVLSFRSAAGRELQKRGPAAVKLTSPGRVRACSLHSTGRLKM